MKMFHKILGYSTAAAAVLVLSASTTQAQNLLTDGNFELGTFTGNPITIATVNLGWANNFGGATPLQSDMSIGFAGSPQNGTYALETVSPVGNTWNPVGTYQVVQPAGGIQIGSTYTLTVWGLQDTATPLTGGFAGAGPIDIQLQFFNAALGNIQTTETTWVAAPLGVWTQYTVTGVAPAGAVYASAYLMNMGNGANTAPNIIFFDNASLTVPEPSTLALLSMGLAVPFYFIRRRKS